MMDEKKLHVHPYSNDNVRRFRSLYGCPPEDVAVAWNMIEQDLPEGIRKNRCVMHFEN